MSNPQALLAVVNAAKQASAVAGKVMASTPKSLASFTKSARIAPYVLIEESLRQQPYISDILHAATSIYAGYYLTAVSLLGDVNGVSVLEKLDRINPNRPMDALGRGGRKLMSMTTEDFKLGLPFKGRPHVKGQWGYSQESHRFVPDAFLAMEAAKVTETTVEVTVGETTNSDGSTTTKTTTRQPEDVINSQGMNRDTVLAAKEASNLAVGKLLEVRMVINGQQLTVPTMVTLFPNTSDSESFAHILSLHTQSQTVRERWHDWRSGDIAFWSDFVMMRDIIKKHRRVLVKDKSGYYAAVSRQSRNHRVASILDAPSLAEASNILVFSTTCARRAEADIGGKLSDFGVREAVFEKTQAMIMFVVDRDREMVKIYHSGIEMANELSVRELKVANKNSGPDVAEILKAYQLGNAPSF